MHDIRFIRDNPEAFDAGLKKRNLPPIAAELLAIDKRRRAAISESETIEARRKATVGVHTSTVGANCTTSSSVGC